MQIKANRACKTKQIAFGTDPAIALLVNALLRWLCKTAREAPGPNREAAERGQAEPDDVRGHTGAAGVAANRGGRAEIVRPVRERKHPHLGLLQHTLSVEVYLAGL